MTILVSTEQRILPSGSRRLLACIQKGTNTEPLTLGLVLVLMLAVFVFDIFTVPDGVSICFIYAVLIFVTMLSSPWASYLCAAFATLLSLLGSLIDPPGEALSGVFFANRTIAVAAQWMAAFLVVALKNVEASMRAEVEEEKKKAETSTRFLDVLSHEIGTSLTTIDGQAFRLRKLAREPSDIALRADKIRNAVRHIQAIVQQVQLASEVGEGTVRMQPADVDLRALVADIVQQSPSGQVLIETDLTALPHAVRGDADMLQQVIGNVVSNAIKYSPPAARIMVKGWTDQGGAMISVIDHGRGIPEDEQGMLFKPYYRARNSRGVHGAGIGLYVAQRFVAGHGGSIFIDSRLGVGTTVTIRLPIAGNVAGESRVAATHSVH